jgi:hypothetical protein
MEWLFTESCELYDKNLVIMSHIYNSFYVLSYLVLISGAYLGFWLRFREILKGKASMVFILSALFVVGCGIGHLLDMVSVGFKLPIIYYLRGIWQILSGVVSALVGITFVVAVYQMNTSAKFIQWFELNVIILAHKEARKDSVYPDD